MKTKAHFADQGIVLKALDSSSLTIESDVSSIISASKGLLGEINVAE